MVVFPDGDTVSDGIYVLELSYPVSGSQYVEQTLSVSNRGLIKPGLQVVAMIDIWKPRPLQIL